MTELNLTTAAPPVDRPPVDPTPRAATGAPVSYARKIARLTFAPWSARFGMVWIVFIALLAAFAPFLANTHPLLMRNAGRWSMPLLAYLTPIDVVLQVMFWTAAVLLALRKVASSRRLAIFGIVSITAIMVCILFVHPRATMMYETYRIGRTSGVITATINTPIHYSPDDHQRDDTDARLKPPTGRHAMGTTADAADMAANMIYATRTAISIGFVSTGIAVALGVIMGGLMGYFGGLVDLIGMRIVEIFQSIPTLILLLAFSSKFQVSPELALYIMMAIIGFLSSFNYAEFVRAEFLSLRDRDFVQAARAAGLPLYSILFRHMLPNGLTPVIVNASFGVAGAILIESTLSFLGIGLQTESSWGSLLDQALSSGGTFYWWLALYPGMAIFLTVMAYNLIGESLRDALDPRLNKME